MASYGEGRSLTPVHSGFAGVHRSQRLRPGIRSIGAPQALVQAIDERCCGSRVGTGPEGRGPFREAPRPAAKATKHLHQRPQTLIEGGQWSDLLRRDNGVGR